MPVQRILGDAEQERILVITLAVAIWAAVLPRLAGAAPWICGILALLALLFPAVFALQSRRATSRDAVL